jgi:hypothetical protein
MKMSAIGPIVLTKQQSDELRSIDRKIENLYESCPIVYPFEVLEALLVSKGRLSFPDECHPADFSPSHVTP